MLPENVVKKLQEVVGVDYISTDKEDRICYSYDATNQHFLPEAVVFPGETKEISEIMKLANDETFPVVPRGAGSGFSGGSLPVQGGLVMVMERLNKVLAIDRENLVALVQPGVVTGDLQEQVERLGLFYPPDPASLKFCTIGGNVAECAGGPRALKYGVTKDYVLGLEVVLPTGEIVKTGVKTVKGVVGYDLTRLMVGSEGTLGVVTEIMLKLIPLPRSFKTMLVVFSDINDAAVTVSEIIASRVIPTTLEFMDQESIQCVEDYLKMGLPVDAGALLLIEVDGDLTDVEKQAELIRDICLEKGAGEVKIAGTKKEAKELWEARRAISPSLARLNLRKINEDVVVPRNKIPFLIEGIREIASKYNLTIANFGHAGDGNIHVNVMVPKDDPEELARGEKAVEEIFKLTVELDGTLSGEHGVGTAKAPYIGMELGAREINIMKEIKNLFDPKGILNPGKIFPDKS
jgi:glycolate oxidase